MTAIEELRHSPEQLRTRIAAELDRARARSRRLTDVDHDELVRQHSPLMSPLVWDYAHIGSQEELWLVRDVGGRDPVRPDIDDIYDAFQTKRADRPSLPMLSPEDARAYVQDVRDKVLDVLEHTPLEGRRLVDAGFAFGMIVQHEQQHVETMFATHQLRTGAPLLDAPEPAPGHAPEKPEIYVPGGMFLMGTDLDPWALDNERPAHAVGLEPYWIDTDPVTNGQYAAFIDAGGYKNPTWWTPEGWEHKNAAGLKAPQFWDDGLRTRFGHVEPIPPDEPVQHVCWYEADAYARWAGKRLPTEAEWEMAARYDPATGRSLRYPWGDDDPTPEHANLGSTYLQPAPVGAYPAGTSPLGVRGLMGDVWEWTSSDFTPYPGFTMFPYPEYSEVFFGPEYKILRGGSWASDPTAVRATFRNWDYPIRRQIFSGFRCARSADV